MATSDRTHTNTHSLTHFHSILHNRFPLRPSIATPSLHHSISGSSPFLLSISLPHHTFVWLLIHSSSSLLSSASLSISPSFPFSSTCSWVTSYIFLLRNPHLNSGKVTLQLVEFQLRNIPLIPLCLLQKQSKLIKSLSRRISLRTPMTPRRFTTPWKHIFCIYLDWENPSCRGYTPCAKKAFQIWWVTLKYVWTTPINSHG